mgnify:CR=1 FL=1|jgi:hypothetical protein|tara:strand:+ start:246 stop:428 length:183 start_codon:yes stop_codon:yes gene_type:complete
MAESILISLDELKKIKLNEKQLLLVIYLIDYYILKEKEKPKGVITLRKKCEYLLGYKVTT